ncbi:hypothetical protein HGP14_26440 [Rhizobium sp. P32RR-XVIII]|uniref:hypothetical protein n=1 Tax=Rhizobium sp. P32RR-XVIII TaxID=2726738 RepID=UPI001456FFAB|nr:hypothetical protein [Rhizobium sp. P32RR-XVIII]NLS06853.1 hypothetical protein [Rhizobium sp. P32RR-XVIII]
MKFFMDHKASPDWAVRRRIIILSLIWIAALVTYLAVRGRPIALSDTAMTNLLWIYGGIVGSYVFGAVWDGKNKQRADIVQQAIEQGTVDASVKVEP